MHIINFNVGYVYSLKSLKELHTNVNNKNYLRIIFLKKSEKDFTFMMNDFIKD